ncbi:MAG: DUF58 domain-containing protein [Truepera sp.]|nr:DUF58 domain-containing protein [Truepera sp.]
MISARSRALLDRYALASHVLSRETGERMATEAGQSVEFHDYRPYQRGDELRYVDWKVYARTGRLYTRLYQAERTINVHLVIDTSPSMALGDKLRYGRLVAQLLSYVAQRDAVCQVHLFDGKASPLAWGRAAVPMAWSFIAGAAAVGGDQAPVAAIKRFALKTRFAAGAGLVIIISDLFDETPLRPALTALKARGLDASFLQLVAASDLEPTEGQLELFDVESGDKLQVGPDEVRAYRQAVQRFLARTRNAVLRAGFRYSLLRVAGEDEAGLERAAFAALLRAGILIRR